MNGNVEALGRMIGCDDEKLSSEEFLLKELASYDPLLKAIRDPGLPAALALYYSRACVLPKPMHSDAKPSHSCHAGPHGCF